MLYITGITGHSGTWFLRRLSAEGYQGKIRCVMREPKKAAPHKYTIFENSCLDIEFAIGDLRDEAFLMESLKGVDTIVHTAGISHSHKLIDVAIKNNVDWAILVHTTGRFSKYKSASSEYINIEDRVMNQCHQANIDGMNTLNLTILRPTMIYGSSKDRNMYRLVEYLSKHKLFPMFGNGGNLMQPVHARDLGNAYYDILMQPNVTKNREYNLSGKFAISYAELIGIVASTLKKNIILIRLPLSFSIFAAKIYNALFKNAIITVEQVMRMQEDKAFSHDDAAKDFGFNPISFEDGIKEEVDEYLRGVRITYTGVKY